VYKVFLDGGKDGVDLEAMAAAGTLDLEAVAGVLIDYLGPTDPRIARLHALVTATPQDTA